MSRFEEIGLSWKKIQGVPPFQSVADLEAHDFYFFPSEPYIFILFGERVRSANIFQGYPLVQAVAALRAQTFHFLILSFCRLVFLGKRVCPRFAFNLFPPSRP